MTAIGTLVETIGAETTGIEISGVESKPAGKPNAVVIGSVNRIGPCDTATKTITATIAASSLIKTKAYSTACPLVLKTPRGIPIALVASCERKRRQPGLATHDPALVGRCQLVRGIEGSEVHFDFVSTAREHG